MTDKKITIEDIIHGYERTRLNNKRLLQQREEEIFEKIPRIKEISISSAVSYLDAARARLRGGAAGRDIARDIKGNNRRLTEEKRNLLVKNGYPADYLDPIFDCSLCKDTGYSDGKKCSCFLSKIIDSLYLQSNLGNILLKENFDTFSFEYYSNDVAKGMNYSPLDNMKSIFKKAKEFADSFETKKNERGNILIYGETGLGKTFISNCIAKQLLDNNHSVLYLSSNELFEDILSGYIMNRKTELEDLHNYIYKCELLIIDDLGTELTNNFVQTQLFEIINKRENLGLSTLVSTNLGMKQLRDRYTERVMSRIIANYTVFNVYGDNIRYQKRKKAINNAT